MTRARAACGIGLLVLHAALSTGALAQAPDDEDEFPASLALPAPVRAEPGTGFTYPPEKPGLHRVSGIASWYGQPFHGRRTASGERFDMHAFTGASNRLPFGTQVRVTEVKTGRSVIVRINDRLHDANPRAIDLSWAAARALGMLATGLVEVTIEVVTLPGPSFSEEPGGR